MSWIIDKDKLARQLLPPVIARAGLLAYVRTLLSGISFSNNLFVSYVAELRKRLRYNGQVIILEALMNDVFQPTLREIYIETNNAQLSQLYVFKSTEAQPKEYVHQSSEAQPVYIYQSNESINSGYDFIVWVPDGLLDAEGEQRIKAIVRRYKLAGKKPVFKYFNGLIF